MRQEREDQAAGQARCVVAEVPDMGTLVIWNHSPAPVLAVRIVPFEAELRLLDGQLVTLQLETVERPAMGPLGPGDKWTVQLTPTDIPMTEHWAHMLLNNYEGRFARMVPVFQILDGEGRLWERSDNGPPRRLMGNSIWSSSP